MQEDRHYYVYIMTNVGNTVLYTGVTGDLVRRVEAHRSGTAGSFCSRYRVTKLVYAEVCDSAYAAISREKQLKGGSRRKKVALIEAENPDWADISGMV